MVWGENDTIVQLDTQQTTPSVSWGKEDIIQQPTTAQPILPANVSWGQQDKLVTDEAMGLVERFGKQLYNVGVATPAHALGKSDVTQVEFAALEAQKKRSADRSAKGIKELSSNLLDDEFSDIVEQLKSAPKARESDDLKTLPQYPEKIDINPFLANVSPAKTFIEKGVDIAASVAGMAAQIAVLRKVLPAGTSEPVIWETQNLATGGKPGMGAVYGGMVGITSKLNASELAKATTDAAGFYTLARVQGATQEEAITQALVPAVLRGAGAAYKGVKGQPAPKPQIIERGVRPSVEKPPTAAIGAQPKPITPSITAPELEQTNKQLLDWSLTAKKLRKEEIVPAVHELRKRQALRGTEYLQRSLAKNEPAWDSLEKSIGGYKDKANIPEITPPNLTTGQWEGYAKKILDVYPAEKVMNQFTRTETQQALKQLRLGKIPTNRQFELLEPILGQETTIPLYKQLSKVRPFAWSNIPKLVVAIAKSPFALDVQYARQASAFTAREPIIYGKGVKTALKAYTSEQFARDVENAIKSNPNHAEAGKYLNFLSRAPYAKGVRAEWFQFGLGERLTELGLKRGKVAKTLLAPVRGYGKWMLASERSFVVSMDSSLQALWDKQTEVWSNEKNMTPALLEAYKKNYGGVINSFMKIMRAKTPSGREIQRLSNYILFSPSMTYARPYQLKTIFTNEGSRGYAAQLTATNIAKIALISTMASLVGNYYRQRGKKPAIDGEINPLRGTWGQIKVNNTWFDFCGGDAQFYRTLGRLTVGAYAYTQQPPMHVGKYAVQKPEQVLTKYGASRETAALGFIKQMLSGKDYNGRLIPRWQTLIRSLPPQFATNTFDAMWSDGVLTGLLATAASTMSAGVSTYPTPAYVEKQDLQDKIAQQNFKKDWDDLNRSQQTALTFKYRKEFVPTEQQIKKERYEAQPEQISIAEQKQTEKWIVSQLPAKQRQLIKDNAISIQISRNIGVWHLDDKKYKRYQQLTVHYLTEQLNKMKTDKPILLKTAVNIAKVKARAQLQQETK